MKLTINLLPSYFLLDEVCQAIALTHGDETAQAWVIANLKAHKELFVSTTSTPTLHVIRGGL